MKSLIPFLVFILATFSATSQMPPLPPAARTNMICPIWFYVTTVDRDHNYGESPPSDEIVWTNFPESFSFTSPTDAVSSYLIYRGTAAFRLHYGKSSGAETNWASLGTATNFSWPLPQPPKRFEIWIAWRSSADLIDWTSHKSLVFCATNATGEQFFKAMELETNAISIEMP